LVASSHDSRWIGSVTITFKDFSFVFFLICFLDFSKIHSFCFIQHLSAKQRTQKIKDNAIPNITTMAAVLKFVVVLLAVWLPTVAHALGTSSSLPDVHAAVIVPGFLTGESDFQPLAETLRKKGIPTLVVPMPAWHWIPCIGGRSIRPILERIDFAVRHVSATIGDDEAPHIPPYQYSAMDCFQDFMDNPGGIQKVGGSDAVDDFPTDVSPRGAFIPPSQPPKARIALIGHSAGGFISRAYLSEREYGGKAYRGTQLVHSLVTLGTPHGDAPGPAFESVKWCNREPCPIRALAVGATGTPGNSSGSLTEGAYTFCCPEVGGIHLDGDGLTTTDSSLALYGPHVTTQVLDNVTHYPWSDAGK
jgi:hypothetical protein